MKKIVSICLSLVLVCVMAGTPVGARSMAIRYMVHGEYGEGVEPGEVYDENETVSRLDRDDFESLENYKGYLEDQGLAYEDIREGEFQAAAVSKAVLRPTALYKASLPSDTKAIQSFYINGSEIYISQCYNNLVRLNGKDYKGQNFVLLSRCTLSGNTKDTFSIADSMLLVGVGHGQTLDMYTYGGKTYFLVSCGSYHPEDSDYIWSTQIGRICYKANTVLNNTDIKRLTYLNYANKANTSFGAVKRVDAALSTNKKQLLIWKRSQNGKNQFSVYDFSTINRLLSSSSGNTVSFKNNATLKNACTCSFDNPSNMPPSFQGVELSDIADGLHSIYIASGNEKEHKANTLTRFNSKGVFRTKVTIDDTGVWGIYNRGYINNTTAEIEGVKIAGDKLQFLLLDQTCPSKQVIACINKSELK